MTIKEKGRAVARLFDLHRSIDALQAPGRARRWDGSENPRMRSSQFALPSNLECYADPRPGYSQQRRPLPMRPIRSKPLIVAVIVISVVIAILSQLGHYASWSLRTRQIAGYSAFGLNAVTAILGFWTPDRAAWAAYLAVSVLAFFLLSVATPLNSLWILMVVAYDWLTHG
jgi:hypothetical protein